jgi:hypothetical protein
VVLKAGSLQRFACFFAIGVAAHAHHQHPVIAGCSHHFSHDGLLMVGNQGANAWVKLVFGKYVAWHGGPELKNKPQTLDDDIKAVCSDKACCLRLKVAEQIDSDELALSCMARSCFGY